MNKTTKRILTELEEFGIIKIISKDKDIWHINRISNPNISTFICGCCRYYSNRRVTEHVSNDVDEKICHNCDMICLPSFTSKNIKNINFKWMDNGIGFKRNIWPGGCGDILIPPDTKAFKKSKAKIYTGE